MPAITEKIKDMNPSKKTPPFRTSLGGGNRKNITHPDIIRYESYFPKYLFDKYNLKDALQILPFYSHSGEL